VRTLKGKKGAEKKKAELSSKEGLIVEEEETKEL
jgi:hypothetical protein